MPSCISQSLDVPIPQDASFHPIERRRLGPYRPSSTPRTLASWSARPLSREPPFWRSPQKNAALLDLVPGAICQGSNGGAGCIPSRAFLEDASWPSCGGFFHCHFG